MTAVDDLVSWLRLQLDDDERVALAIKNDRYGDNDGDDWKHWTITRIKHKDGPYLSALGVELVHSYGDNVITPQRGEHIARWDPARVLAEIDAKRRILDEAEHWMWNDDNGGPDPMAAATMRLLALPYAGRDGYRSEWQPTT